MWHSKVLDVICKEFLFIFETNKITFLSKNISCFITITRVIFGPNRNATIKFVFNFFLGAPLFSGLIRLNAIRFQIRVIGWWERICDQMSFVLLIATAHLILINHINYWTSTVKIITMKLEMTFLNFSKWIRN